MAGTNAGTGQPIAFVCPRERAAKSRDRILHRYGPRHRPIERTGRSRPYRARGRGPKGHGLRTLATAWEYRCRWCGHVGWSAHIDIVTFPIEFGGEVA